MAAISASFSFTPSVQASSIVVTGDSLTEIRSKVKAVLETKRQASQAQIEVINAADAALDA